MVNLCRVVSGAVALLLAVQAWAVQLAYEPVGLGWSADEVERPAAATWAALLERADRAQQSGCVEHCERVARIFSRLLIEAREQTTRSANLPWALSVVRLPDVDAQAMPGGQVVVSESFLDQHALTDEALAFVLAHEMAHIILEHERQALTFARLFLPRQPARSVGDMYVEMDFNLSLLRSMAPVLHQGEFEADELGFLMASAAGFSPDRQLAFVEQECSADGQQVRLLATHPSACARLQALQAMLPLARRQHVAHAP